jgi:hypothetical protein
MELYKMRHPGGRPRKYTPETLWKSACGYFDWCNAHPWIKHEAIKSGQNVGTLVGIPTVIPYTIEGLCTYCGVSENFLRANRQIDNELSTVIEEIYRVVETQQFTGAAVGAFNANIIARKLGLVEKTNISTPEGEELRVNIAAEHRVIFEDYEQNDTDI